MSRGFTVTDLANLLERAARPGVLGVVGKAVERKCTSDLKGYFVKLRTSVLVLGLDKLALPDANPEIVRHTVVMAMRNVLRRRSTELQAILEVNILSAYTKANKFAPYAEADEADLLLDDPLGPVAQEAADYAAQKSGDLVKGLNETTQDDIAEAIMNGIEKQLGVPGTARLIQSLMDGMTTARAEMIASTEMNDAMSEATLRKLQRLDITYKQLILSDDACPICQSIAENGPVPTDEPFVDEDGEEYDRTPIHPRCRCATTGARPPSDEGA